MSEPGTENAIRQALSVAQQEYRELVIDLLPKAHRARVVFLCCRQLEYQLGAAVSERLIVGPEAEALAAFQRALKRSMLPALAPPGPPVEHT